MSHFVPYYLLACVLRTVLFLALHTAYHSTIQTKCLVIPRSISGPKWSLRTKWIQRTIIPWRGLGHKTLWLNSKIRECFLLKCHISSMNKENPIKSIKTITKHILLYIYSKFSAVKMRFGLLLLLLLYYNSVSRAELARTNNSSFHGRRFQDFLFM